MCFLALLPPADSSREGPRFLFPSHRIFQTPLPVASYVLSAGTNTFYGTRLAQTTISTLSCGRSVHHARQQGPLTPGGGAGSQVIFNGETHMRWARRFSQETGRGRSFRCLRALSGWECYFCSPRGQVVTITVGILADYLVFTEGDSISVIDLSGNSSDTLAVSEPMAG
jgi:hypothetical protein